MSFCHNCITRSVLARTKVPLLVLMLGHAAPAVPGAITRDCGTFAPHVTYGAGDQAFSVAIGDLDGVGGPDLAVANRNSDDVSVLLNLCVEVEPCPWDLNGDGVVNVADLLILIFSFGPCDDPDDCPADFNGDGFVGVLDLLALLQHFGRCPGFEECPWDLNGDGVVDHSDLHELLQHLGPCKDPDDCPWDFDGDGVVGPSDILLLVHNFGPCP